MTPGPASAKSTNSRTPPSAGAHVDANFPVDIVDRSTWPPELVERVRKLAEELVGSTDCTSDLALEQHDEEFRTLLEGHLVRAYHSRGAEWMPRSASPGR